jgi:hypothetical protein
MKKVPSAISPVIAVNRKAAKPLHKQIYDAYRAMIVGRNLSVGQQIPSTRLLAAELKISRIACRLGDVRMPISPRDGNVHRAPN